MAKIAALVTEPVDRPNSMKSLEEHILKLANRNNCVDCDLKSVEIAKLFDDFKQTILAKIDYSKATDLKPSYVC